ncbi:MAG: lipopolysaccharide kinase InaA family protein [Saccharospirillum sp.]
MTESQSFTDLQQLGSLRFTGQISAGYGGDIGRAWLEQLPERLANSSKDQLLFQLRNRVYRLPCPLGGPDLCIKAFKTPDALRSLVYRRQGSKAQRAHQYARHLCEHGAAVAEPIGYIEQWRGHRLIQSYLISRYVDNSTDLYSEMTHLLRQRPYAGDFIRLLRTAATAVRTMHDSGFLHGDLGPQNILMTRVGEAEWANITFIDLNRGRLVPNPSLKQRAKDLDRMKVPTHFRQIFYHIYFNDGDIPAEFQRWSERYKERFYWHQRSRQWRHPVRSLKQWLAPKPPERKEVSTGQPKPRDVWIWDEHSGQPSVVLKGRDRRRQRAAKDVWPTLFHCLKQAPAIYTTYKTLKTRAFQQTRPMSHGLGVSVEVDECFEQQRQALAATPNASLMVRCYYHLGEAHIRACEHAIAQLKQDGHSVSLALIQNRDAVNHPNRWADFVSKVLECTHAYLDCVEVAHAVNRVKWGFWNLEEMGRLWQQASQWRQRYPNLTFLGPAVNDFEFQYYPPLLAQHSEAFHALSGHLYVDRRGAPEAEQNGFSTLEKALLARAIANTHGKTGYYITEVNWPIRNTGLNSPLAGAYIKNGAKESPLHVSEEESAAYMIRYALITLCSGAADRLWWWRLAHPGFGLIDHGNGWRERPGWKAFVQFHNTVGNQRFLKREEKDSAIWWQFERTTLAYSTGSAQITVPGDTAKVTDLYGNSIEGQPSQRLIIGGSPVYFV